MTCLCLPRLQALVGGLLPIASLRVSLPPVVSALDATMRAGGTGGSAFSLRAALELGLPPLPLPALQVDRIAASATATTQLAAGFGIELLSADGPSRLALALRSLRLHLPSVLPLPGAFAAGLPGAMSLSLALSAIARLRGVLGIDLLAPGAALALKAALAAAAPPPAVPPAIALRIAAYARLSAAAQTFGGFDRLMPALELLAKLELPSIDGGAGPLAMLSLLLGLQASIRATLGLDPSSPDLQLRLAAALRPLAALPPMALDGALPSTASIPLPSLSAGFAADAQALAGLELGAIAKLPLPNLAPLSLAASVSAAGGLASPGCCTGS